MLGRVVALAAAGVGICSPRSNPNKASPNVTRWVRMQPRPLSHLIRNRLSKLFAPSRCEFPRKLRQLRDPNCWRCTTVTPPTRRENRSSDLSRACDNGWHLSRTCDVCRPGRTAVSNSAAAIDASATDLDFSGLAMVRGPSDRNTLSCLLLSDDSHPLRPANIVS